ncbi:coiled-coil domain-containing protein 57 [Anas platyrhynchos]|uniref:coiled-coil domain-containing protein 57 n=1 Tax=Anas platyrhynchos TaxID=8839 RepID=UPI003AF22D76
MVLGGWERMLGEKPISTGLLSKKGGSEGNRLAVPNKAGAGGSSRLTAAGPAVGGRGRGRRSADWVRALLAGGPPAANAGTDVRGRGSHGDAPPPHRAGGAHHGSHRDTAYSREQEDGSDDSHIGHQCEEYISLKHHMERKIQEVKGELACQKQAEAYLQKTGYRLHEVETLLSAMTVEKEQTVQASLLNYGIFSEGEKQTLQYDDKSYLRKDIPILEIQKLKEQNASLRAAVAQMRKEMESLDEQIQSSLPLTEQTITGLTTETLSLNPGSFCTDQVSVRTTLNNINVSSNNLGCIISPNTEKGSKHKSLEEKMVDFCPISDNCCPDVSLQYGFSCPLQGVQNKLNEAARKIPILSQEKQQLTEMGNRHRADIGMVLKEGLWHPISSKRCTICVASGSLSPRELLKRTQCQLSALKHLQHRLATQELQYAKQHHLSRISSVISCPNLKGEKAPSSCGEETELPSAQVNLDFCTGSCGPEQQKAHTSSKMVQSQPFKESPSQAQQTWISSSRAHRSCQGIWQTLEMRSSPSILSSQNNTKQALEFEVTCSSEQSEESQQNIKAKDKLEMPAADLTVRGTKLEVQQKLKSRILSCTYPIKQKISSNMSKIRNYNIKD